jgi:hypothetical protein
MSSPISPDNPVFLTVSPTQIAIAFGATVQLVPLLTDVDGNTIEPTRAFIYSTNSALATVSSSGLVTGASLVDPNTLQEGGIAEITVTYPFSNRSNRETISATSRIKVLANPARTVYVLRTDDTVGAYQRSNASKWTESTVQPVAAPAPSYPSNWIITNN